jgi:beta-N-acetylhexosaminidase
MPLICKDRGRVVAAIGAVEKAVADGTISTKRLEQSLTRLARVKRRFLPTFKPATLSDARLIVGCRTHRALVHTIDQARARAAKVGL